MKQFLILFILLLSISSQAARKAKAPPAPPAPFDQEYSDFTEQLKKIVVVKNNISQVDYKKLQRDSKGLNKFLKESGKVSQKTFDTFNEKEQMAFLINTYNGLTLKLIVDNYPLQSIKKIGGMFSSPWKMKFFRLLGKEHSLDDIENDMLRKTYHDPRVHFSVNCASIGCPMLRAEAYVGSRLDAQLDEQAKLFLRDNERNVIDAANKTLKLSKIFSWFEEDFTQNGNSVQKFIAHFITDDPSIQKLLESGAFAISYTEYNWDLNSLKE